MGEHEPDHEPTHCQALLSSLSEYIDGDLTPELCSALESHLSGCPRCRVVVDTLRKTVELYHECADENPLPDDVRSRLLVKLDLKDFRKDP